MLAALTFVSSFVSFSIVCFFLLLFLFFLSADTLFDSVASSHFSSRAFFRAAYSGGHMYFNPPFKLLQFLHS
jgi:hypothetical protein